jgi:peptidoglycan-N-acetylglucosamine deacetylase
MRTGRMRNVVAAIAATAGLTLFEPALAAAECPGNPDALGTSRTLVIDPAEHPRVGSMQYHETLPLEDHEIVITFDDGPLPPRSTRVLEILDHECVKATFFLIGKMAHTFPEDVRRIRDAGHTIGTHSYSHPLTFQRMSLDKAEFEINQGIALVTSALGDGSGPAPFFRIPGLLRVEGVEHYLASQNIQVWSADEVADDWRKIGPGQVYSRALRRIEANHKGILLLHDIQPKTVEALPYLLRELKRRGYRVVQVVPATPDRPKTATDPGQWVMHAHLSPRTPISDMPGWPSRLQLPGPSPQDFGYPGDGAKLSDAAKAWTDTVTESRGVVAVDEIQRLLELSPEPVLLSVNDHNQKIQPSPAADASIRPIPPQPLHGPIANAAMPRGGFP